MNGLIRWFTENHVASNLLMVFLLVAGFMTAQTVKVETFPDFSLDIINISVEYPGASPEEIEESIVQRIEERIAGLAGIKEINSTAQESYGSVNIEVVNGWDIENLVNDVKSEVDRIRTFPAEAERPVVRQIVRTNQVINLAVFGDADEATIKHLAEKIKDDLTELPGITLVDLFGVKKGEIHIDISEKDLRRYHLTLDQVADRVRKASLDLPAGSIKSSDGTIMIRTKGRRYYASDYTDIAVITDPDGHKVTLGQIATLTDGFEDIDIHVKTKGKPAAFIQVYRVADQSALKVANEVKEYVKEIEEDLPEGIEIVFFADMSEILKSRLNLLIRNMALGLILVIILLSLFLNPKLAFWVTLGIPISFATALWLLPLFNVSINLISLFAFILILGIVVDDAIVIGENIYRKRENGIDGIKGAVSGAAQVSRPVIFAVLTTIAAFYPLLMIPGVRGNFMRNIPIVVILVLLGSLLESLFILPGHLARSRFKGINHSAGDKRTKWSDRKLKEFIKGPYSRALRFSLKWRYAVVASGIALLLITAGIFQSGRIKFSLFPKIDADNLVCSVVMPPSTPVEKTEEVLAHIERSAIEMVREIDSKRPPNSPSVMEEYFSLIGVHMGGGGPMGTSTSGGHLAQVHIQLLEGEKRKIKASLLANEWRKKTGPIPEARTVSFVGQLRAMDSPVEVHLSSNNNQSLLEAVEAMKDELSQFPGLIDINDNFLPGKDELQMRLKPSARALGLSLNDLARQVRAAFYGSEALRIQRDKDEVKILVRYPDSERKTLDNIENMRIRTPDGTEIPFAQIASVNMKQGYAVIQRSQRKRVIAVTADVEEEIANASEINARLEEETLDQLSRRFPDVRFIIEGSGKEDKEFMSSIGRSFLFALFLIYALLAIPFRSFSQPIIVMTAIPFGIVGAIMGHMLMGFDISMMSMFGIVGLSGVVVNDSLVLIEATNRIKDSGKSHFEAITSAGALRFRAIILTSITTFGGLTPMLMERSLQAKFLIPMAAGLGYGVLFATGITLILIPCLYLILEDIHILWKNLKSSLS
ncbi:MAG: efflux RND transporter permease subunit [Candidatus Krumholzibacteriota bacterium]|nr:efflux RND transporter permease subunit [Candidatus Krumholzibacteriota bacterium]